MWKEVYSISVRWYHPPAAHVNDGIPTIAHTDIYGFADSTFGEDDPHDMGNVLHIPNEDDK